MMIYKRTISILLALIFAISIMIPTASAVFSDVPSNAWYANDVNDVQRYGILKGTGNNKFNPNGNMSLAEAITLTARTYAYLRGETIPTTNSSPWYNDYVKYANDNGICSTGEFGTEYNKFCNRLTMAHLFARVVSQEKTLNSVTELPDVQNKDAYKDVFYLYNQGILTGSDEYGTFKPYSQITRAEAAAILNRVLNASKRIQKTLTPIPSVEGTYCMVSDVYDGKEYGPNDDTFVIGINGQATWKMWVDGNSRLENLNRTYIISGNTITVYDSEGVELNGTVKPNVLVFNLNSDRFGFEETFVFAKQGSKEKDTLTDSALSSMKKQAAAAAKASEDKERANNPWYDVLNPAMEQAYKYFYETLEWWADDYPNLGRFAYAYYDIDGNGVNELLVGFTMDEDGFFYAAYTLQNGHAVCLKTTTSLDPTKEYMCLHGNGIIGVISKAGYNYSEECYRFNNGKLTKVNASSVNTSNTVPLDFMYWSRGSTAFTYVNKYYPNAKIGCLWQYDNWFSHSCRDEFSYKCFDYCLDYIGDLLFTSTSSNDFSSQISEFKKAGVTIVYLPVKPEYSSKIISQAKSMGYTPKWLLLDGSIK